MSDETVTLVRAMAARFVELEPMLSEWADEDETTLPHLFMADAERWLEQLVAAGELHIATDLLGYLEEAYKAGAVDVREVIGASFVEHLPTKDTCAGKKIRTMLGAQLKAQLALMGG